MAPINKSRGCPKCDFTGFSYGKIPCVCMEQTPPKVPEPQGHMEVDYSRGLPFIFTGKSSKDHIVPGDPVYIGDTLIGRAITGSTDDGFVEVSLGPNTTARVAAKDIQKYG